MMKLELEDIYGSKKDVVLGYDILEKYLDNEVYFGAVIGRYAGEITPASFYLNGRQHELWTNQNGWYLHGGKDGISFNIWDMYTSANEVGFL